MAEPGDPTRPDPGDDEPPDDLDAASDELADELAEVEPRPGRAIVLTAGLVAVVVGLLWVLLATSDSAEDRIGTTPLAGEPAPAIVRTTVDGEAFDLDDLRGQWVVVNFFATWCAPCIDEHPELVAFAERHTGTGDATVVSVAFDDTASRVVDFFETYGGDWPVIVDEPGPIAVDYGVARVPESYLVAPSGVVAAKLVGGIEADTLDDIIAELSGTGEAAS